MVALVLLYFGKVERATAEFAEGYSQFATSKIEIGRMKELWKLKPKLELAGKVDFSRNWKRLEFRKVNFSYQGKKVLNKLSFKINRGQKVGIVGVSGAGKSTLFKLLLKLYENYQGQILFDQVKLSDLKRADYLKRVAVVPQDTELFNLSLAENITLTSGSKNKKLLEQAVQISHVKEFVAKLPQGVNSLVGEKGVKLSGGERQRVGLARAIYRQSDVLLLDEATSHLDVESEHKIQAALHDFFKGITAIVIAHRLSTLKEMDRILVLDQGQVVEEGSFEELLAAKGVFYKLWQQQSF